MPVYFIQAVDGGNIKIGFATDPQERLAEIQSMSPKLLQVIGVIEGDRKTEGIIHRYFARLREHGEWFRPDKAIKEFLINPILKSELPTEAIGTFFGYISTVEAACITGYTRQYIANLLKSGKVKDKMIGQRWLVDSESILLYRQGVTQ